MANANCQLHLIFSQAKDLRMKLQLRSFFFYGGNFILIDSFKTKFGFIIFHCHHHHYYHCYYVILVIFIIVIVILMIIVVDS